MSLAVEQAAIHQTMKIVEAVEIESQKDRLFVAAVLQTMSQFELVEVAQTKSQLFVVDQNLELWTGPQTEKNLVVAVVLQKGTQFGQVGCQRVSLLEFEVEWYQIEKIRQVFVQKVRK